MKEDGKKRTQRRFESIEGWERVMYRKKWKERVCIATIKYGTKFSRVLFWFNEELASGREMGNGCTVGITEILCHVPERWDVGVWSFGTRWRGQSAWSKCVNMQFEM
jgi:hypothetical protein